MENKVILITGAASGMGKATAINLVKTGYKNFTFVDQHKENLESVVKECKQLGDIKVCSLLKDLEDPFTVCKEIIDATIKEFNRLDALISNAGIVGDINYARNLNEEKLNRIFNINLFASMSLTKYALPYLAETKGSIVYTSSIVSKMPQKEISPYCATKAALSHYARCVALEEGKNGVRVNAVCPGLTKTKLFTNFFQDNEELMRETGKKLPMETLGNANEIAEVITFLVSDKNSYMTGSEIFVDGGMQLTNPLHL